MVLPLAVVASTPESDAFRQLRELIHSRAVRTVVVGLPVHPDMRQAGEIKRFTRRLRKGISGVRWRFFDESLTSEAVEGVGQALGEGKKSSPADDRAAALILESFLQSLPRD